MMLGVVIVVNFTSKTTKYIPRSSIKSNRLICLKTSQQFLICRQVLLPEHPLWQEIGFVQIREDCQNTVYSAHNKPEKENTLPFYSLLISLLDFELL